MHVILFAILHFPFTCGLQFGFATVNHLFSSTILRGKIISNDYISGCDCLYYN